MDDKEKSRWRTYGALLLAVILLLLSLTYCLQVNSADTASNTGAPNGNAGADGVSAQTEEVSDPNVFLTATSSEEGAVLSDGVNWEIFRLNDLGSREFVRGHPYARGLFALEPGRYVARGQRGTTYGEALIELGEGETVEKSIIVGSGEVQVSAIALPGGAMIENDLSWEVYEITPEGTRRYITGYPYARSAFALSPRPHVFHATMGLASAEMQVDVQVGRTLDSVLVMNAGSVHVSALNAAGAPMTQDVSWEVYRRGPNGEQSYVSRSPYPTAQFHMNAGAYDLMAVATDGQKITRSVDVAAGDSLEISARFE